ALAANASDGGKSRSSCKTFWMFCEPGAAAVIKGLPRSTIIRERPVRQVGRCGLANVATANVDGRTPPTDRQASPSRVAGPSLPAPPKSHGRSGERDFRDRERPSG